MEIIMVRILSEEEIKGFKPGGDKECYIKNKTIIIIIYINKIEKIQLN